MSESERETEESVVLNAIAYTYATNGDENASERVVVDDEEQRLARLAAKRAIAHLDAWRAEHGGTTAMAEEVEIEVVETISVRVSNHEHKLTREQAETLRSALEEVLGPKPATLPEPIIPDHWSSWPNVIATPPVGLPSPNVSPPYVGCGTTSLKQRMEQGSF